MICQLLNRKQTPYILLIKRRRILIFTTLWFPSINFTDRSPFYSKVLVNEKHFQAKLFGIYSFITN